MSTITLALLGDQRMEGRRTQWVATRKLRLLRILGCELISDAVEQLNVGLLGVFLY